MIPSRSSRSTRCRSRRAARSTAARCPSRDGRLAAGASTSRRATQLEEEIAAIWAELLGVDQVGVEDDFFALGGHSLLATQMIMRIRRTHGDVPLQALFTAPTVGALANVIAERAEAG